MSGPVVRPSSPARDEFPGLARMVEAHKDNPLSAKTNKALNGALDLIDSLRAELAVSRQDADRLAAQVRHARNCYVLMPDFDERDCCCDARDALAAHAALVAGTDRDVTVDRSVCPRCGEAIPEWGSHSCTSGVRVAGRTET